MAHYEKTVRDTFTENGCYFQRHGKGGHDIWFSPLTNLPITVDGKILSRHTANGIMKRAGSKYHF